jgi:hypothetical protein
MHQVAGPGGDPVVPDRELELSGEHVEALVPWVPMSGRPRQIGRKCCLHEGEGVVGLVVLQLDEDRDRAEPKGSAFASRPVDAFGHRRSSHG